MNDWKKYIINTRDSKPRPLTVEGLGYQTETGQALDLGAGNLNDTRFLVEKGFSVTAVDNEPFVAELANELNLSNIHIVISTFSQYQFPVEYFDFVTSQLSLCFQSQEDFDAVFPKIISSMKSRAVFAFDLFGINDDWNKENLTGRIFFTDDQVVQLLHREDLVVIKNETKEWDGSTAAGTQKHWHTFQVIVRKK